MQAGNCPNNAADVRDSMPPLYGNAIQSKFGQTKDGRVGVTANQCLHIIYAVLRDNKAYTLFIQTTALSDDT